MISRPVRVLDSKSILLSEMSTTLATPYSRATNLPRNPVYRAKNLLYLGWCPGYCLGHPARWLYGLSSSKVTLRSCIGDLFEVLSHAIPLGFCSWRSLWDFFLGSHLGNLSWADHLGLTILGCLFGLAISGCFIMLTTSSGYFSRRPDSGNKLAIIQDIFLGYFVWFFPW